MTLVIVHEITCNSPLGEPQPPFGEDYHWHAVRLDRDQTFWRRIGIDQTEAAPAPGMQTAKCETLVSHLSFHQAVKALAARRRRAPP